MSNRQSFRIVIQRIDSVGSTRYRIVAYGGNRHPAHSDFSTAERLLAVVRAAIPDLDEGKLALGGAGESSIVFVRDMDLDDNQLRVLGLN